MKRSVDFQVTQKKKRVPNDAFILFTPNTVILTELRH